MIFTRSHYADVLARLQAEAQAAMAPYPQYAGKFDACVLGVIRRDWASKGGVRLHKGDVVLVRPIPESHDGLNLITYTVFSWRTNSHCAVDTNDVRMVATTS